MLPPDEDEEVADARADGLGEVLGPLPRLVARVLGAHVARVKDAAAELARVDRDVGRRLGVLARDAPSVRDDLLICAQVRHVKISTCKTQGAREEGERESDALPSAAALATRRHMEKTMVAVAHESMPPLNGTK